MVADVYGTINRLWDAMMPMSNDTVVSEADCVLCRDLDADHCLLMRADLLEIPLR